MAGKTKKEKFIITDSFVYKGYDGKSKKTVTLSPGEDVPKLDPNERARLEAEGKIEKVDIYGERVNTKDRDAVELKQEDAQRLIERSPARVADILNSTKFTKDSLNRLLLFAEKNKAPKNVTDMIEARLDGRV